MNSNQARVVHARSNPSRPTEVMIRFKPAARPTPKNTNCPSKRWNRLLLGALLRRLRELHVRLATLTEEALVKESPEIVLAMFTSPGAGLMASARMYQLGVEIQSWRWGHDEVSETFFDAVDAVYPLMIESHDLGEDQIEEAFEKNFIAAKPFLEWLGPPLDLPV